MSYTKTVKPLSSLFVQKANYESPQVRGEQLPEIRKTLLTDPAEVVVRRVPLPLGVRVVEGGDLLPAELTMIVIVAWIAKQIWLQPQVNTAEVLFLAVEPPVVLLDHVFTPIYFISGQGLPQKSFVIVSCSTDFALRSKGELNTCSTLTHRKPAKNLKRR